MDFCSTCRELKERDKRSSDRGYPTKSVVRHVCNNELYQSEDFRNMIKLIVEQTLLGVSHEYENHKLDTAL